MSSSTGKTARVWLQGKGGGLAPGQTLVLLPVKKGETDELPVARRLSRAAAPGADRRQCRPVNVVVCEADYRALKRGIGHLPPPTQ